MNINWLICVAFISALYFESKLVPVWWLRIIVYIVFMMLMVLWSYLKEQRFQTQWQQLVGGIQNLSHVPDFSPNEYGRKFLALLVCLIFSRNSIIIPLFLSFNS